MTAAPKKMLMLAILEILQKYTDADHRMLQTEILAKLESDYQLTVTRKSVGTNITELVAAGYPLEYDKGWYYDHAFCATELNLLIDSLLFNPNIPYSQCLDLIRKIQTLGGVRYKPVIGKSLNKPTNPQFLYTFEILYEAIQNKKRVTFQYGDYATDKLLHPRTTQTGEAKLYDVNPYRIVLNNGRYYLIGNVHKYDNAAHFRIDHILEITITDQPAKEVREVRGLENGLNIPEYMITHAQMFPGEVRTVDLTISRKIINEALEWFGMDIKFHHETEETVDVSVRTDENSLYYWLKMYDAFAKRR